MSRGNPRFRQADLVRAIKAAQAAGQSLARVEITEEGRIVIVFGKPGDAERPERDLELEKWFAHHEKDE